MLGRRWGDILILISELFKFRRLSYKCLEKGKEDFCTQRTCAGDVFVLISFKFERLSNARARQKKGWGKIVLHRNKPGESFLFSYLNYSHFNVYLFNVDLLQASVGKRKERRQFNIEKARGGLLILISELFKFEHSLFSNRKNGGEVGEGRSFVFISPTSNAYRHTCKIRLFLLAIQIF